jgi:hypothetical protein
VVLYEHDDPDPATRRCFNLRLWSTHEAGEDLAS